MSNREKDLSLKEIFELPNIDSEPIEYYINDNVIRIQFYVTHKHVDIMSCDNITLYELFGWDDDKCVLNRDLYNKQDYDAVGRLIEIILNGEEND